MKILALDMAFCTGFAIAEKDVDGIRIIESGIMRFDRRRGESNGFVYLRVRKWMQELMGNFKELCIADGETGLVAYEQPHHRGGSATEIAYAFQTRAQEVASRFGLLSFPVATGTVKSHIKKILIDNEIEYKGKISKPHSIMAARVFLDHDPVTDDEADAVIIAHFGAGEYAPDESVKLWTIIPHSLKPGSIDLATSFPAKAKTAREVAITIFGEDAVATSDLIELRPLGSNTDAVNYLESIGISLIDLWTKGTT